MNTATTIQPLTSIAAAPSGKASPTTRPAASALAVEGLRLVHGGRTIIDGVSWQAAAGETVCLLGHSGCGKTTLLRLIAGLERPQSGRVLLDGEEVTGERLFVAPEQRRIGLVFQDYALFPHLTVLANVMFGLRSRNSASSRATAMRELERVHLAHHADSYPHTLSGGEQQRVALARALAPQPRVVLMDEPFSNLDRRLRDRVRDETMALLREAGTTAIVVTHDPEEALRIADHIVLMRDGRIEQNSRSERIYRQPASLFAARFFCDLNELPGVCHNGSVDTILGRFDAPAMANGGTVRVCLRPHDIRLSATPTGIAGQVRERLFLGEAEQLRIAIEGLDTPLLVRQFEPSHACIGDTVHLDLHRSQALLFANES